MILVYILLATQLADGEMISMSYQDHVFMEFQFFFSLAFLSTFQQFILIFIDFKCSGWVLNQDQSQYSCSIHSERTAIWRSLLQKCSIENDSHSEILLSFQLSSQTRVFMSLTWHLLVQKSELQCNWNLFCRFEVFLSVSVYCYWLSWNLRKIIV